MRFVAVIVEARQIQAARYTADGVQEASVALHTSPQDGLAAVLRRVRSAVRQMWPLRGPVTAVGVGVAGVVDGNRGVVRSAPDLGDWHDVPLRDALVEAFGVPCFAGPLGGVAALAEHRFGAGRHVRDLLYFDVDERLRSGVIVDQRLLVGGGGLGGDVGHVLARCAPHADGAAEAEALADSFSGPAIARRFAQAAAAQAAENSAQPLTARQVCEAARAGDALAREVLADVAHRFGRALVLLQLLLDPNLVVLNGLPTVAGDAFLAPVRQAFQEHVPPMYREHVQIVPAQLGDNIGLWGALALCLTGLDL